MTPLTDEQKAVYDFIVSHQYTTCGSVSLHLWCSMAEARLILNELVRLGMLHKQLGPINHYYAVITKETQGEK